MKVAIYANIASTGFGGGIETYLGALIEALGKLDGPEEYIVLGPEKNGEWLESLCGPNQTVIRLGPCSSDWTKRFARRVGQILVKAENWSARNRMTQIHTKWVGQLGLEQVVPISSGFIEALNPAVIHFPYQKFVLTSIPSIYNPHDLQHLHLPQFFSAETLMERELSYPFACRLASKVAVCSNWIAEDLVDQYRIPMSKIAVIPWGAATSRFSVPTTEDVRAVRKQYDLEREYIFYPAIAWGHKNHINLLEALKIIRSRGRAINLVLAGAGTGKSEFLKHAINQAGVSDAVRLLDYVPNNHMRSITSGALAVVVPSLFEAASGPIMDAWQDNTPVGCSDIPQLREQANDAAIFFNPLLPDSIADAVQALISDAALRERLVIAGRAKLAKLSWARTAELYRTAYREVASRSGRLLHGPT